MQLRQVTAGLTSGYLRSEGSSNFLLHDTEIATYNNARRLNVNFTRAIQLLNRGTQGKKANERKKIITVRFEVPIAIKMIMF
jgi:tmRNA-binding protein